MTLEPLQPAATLPFYRTELRRRLATAEERLRLQDQYIVQSRAILALTEHLATL